MKIKIEFTFEGEAFEPLQSNIEIGRILTKIGREFFRHEYETHKPAELGRIRDVNGNVIGHVKVTR